MAWIKKWRWDVDKPADLRVHIGRFCRVKNERGQEIVVECQEILGSLAHPTKFQINEDGKSYLISMLDFFAQMNGETVTPQEIADFDALTFDVRANQGWKPFSKDRRKIWTPK